MIEFIQVSFVGREITRTTGRNLPETVRVAKCRSETSPFSLVTSWGSGIYTKKSTTLLLHVVRNHRKHLLYSCIWM